jgi:SAM-dependent methyltransferase
MAVTALIERLLEHPAVYQMWQAPFARAKFAPVQRSLPSMRGLRVLDVGCGPGTNASVFDGSEYVGIDINERYLAVARTRCRGRFVQADLATADLSSLGLFDVIVINSFLHHLPDEAVSRLLAQLAARLAPRGHVHVLELVLPDRWSIGRVMARLDRGRFARSASAWNALLTAHFDPIVFEPYSLGPGIWAMVHFQGRLRSCASQ